jgi:orotidine-5'-phosphate decarboxylase
MTVVAYQGLGSLAEPIRLAVEHDKGLFVLAATSNPEAVATQTAQIQLGKTSGRSVAGGIVSEVNALNTPQSGLGPIGVVVGATVNLVDYGISTAELSRTPILAPGFGEQGALLTDLPRLFGSVAGNVVANVGRSVLRAGASGIRDELSLQSGQLREASRG